MSIKLVQARLRAARDLAVATIRADSYTPEGYRFATPSTEGDWTLRYVSIELDELVDALYDDLTDNEKKSARLLFAHCKARMDCAGYKDMVVALENLTPDLEGVL